MDVTYVSRLNDYNRKKANVSSHWTPSCRMEEETICHLFSPTYSICYLLLLLESHIFIGRKYRFLSFKNLLNEISKIKNLERRVVVKNRNKCKNLGRNDTEYKIKYPFLRTLEESRADGIKGLGGIVGSFYFIFIHFISLNMYVCVYVMHLNIYYVYIYVFM